MKKILYLVCLLTPTMAFCQTEQTTQQTTTTTMPQINMSINGQGVTTQQTTITTTTTTTNGDMGQPQQAPPPPPQQQAPPPPPPAQQGCVQPMMWNDYESAKKSISEKDFEDTKLTMAKQIVKANCMSAEQIRGIMKLFTFENNKLDFAKYAYDYCTDKGNYFKVNDAFTFDHSSQELNDYISNH
jgi:Domain of unknown function (DUF4476)